MARRIRSSFGALAFFLLIGVSVIFAETQNDGNLIEELKLFSKAIGAIHEAYVKDIPPRTLLYAAVKGMLDSLEDKYTEFIDPGKFKLLQIHMKGEYAGVGIILQSVDNYPIARALQPGSPAEKAGIQAGDKILKINGNSTEKKELPEIATLLRGDENTPVTLTLERPATQKVFDVTIKREKITLEAIQDARMVGKKAGYIRLAAWNDHTYEQFDKSWKDMKKQGLKALIVDLRDNDGGLLTQAVQLAGKFLPKGEKIVSVESKIAEQRKEYFSEGDKEMADKDDFLIVLVNHQSASASEIFSIAMQDHKRATIVGSQTYGKASAQSVVPLDDATAMKLTTARYRSPAGRMIDEVGLTPDVIVEESEPDKPGGQKALLSAISLLKDYM